MTAKVLKAGLNPVFLNDKAWARWTALILIALIVYLLGRLDRGAK